MHKPSVRVVRRDQLSDNTPQTPDWFGRSPSIAATPTPTY